MVIDPFAPIADGIQFDDLFAVPRSLSAKLIGRGLVWATTFSAGGKTFGGSVIASSEAQAAAIAFARGLGEVVTGPLLKVSGVQP